MSRIGGNLLRDATPQEYRPLLADKVGNGFTLRNIDIKRMRSTNAAVHFFDVIDPQGNRLGVASLVLEPSVDVVRDFGHVCVTLAEGKSNPQLLADVGQLVFNTAYEHGLEEIRVVVPDDHAASVGACDALNPCATAERLSRDGESFLAYKYQKA